MGVLGQSGGVEWPVCVKRGFRREIQRNVGGQASGVRLRIWRLQTVQLGFLNGVRGRG